MSLKSVSEIPSHLEVRMTTEAENSRLMKIKYEEKQAEDTFLKEQKEVEAKLEDLNRRNLEYFEKSRTNHNRIKENDEKIIDNNNLLKEAENKHINRLRLDKEERVAAIEKAEKNLEKKKNKKMQMIKKLKRLKVYETFLLKVMKASQDYEKEEKPREGLRKMIDRYELLKTKQSHLIVNTNKLDQEKKQQMEKKIQLERDLQNKVLKMTSEMHTIQREIEKRQKDFRELETQIQKKIQENQEKAIESAKIEMAVYNLYKNAKKIRQVKEKEGEKEDQNISMTKKVINRLEFIRTVMGELKFFSDSYETYKKEQNMKKSKGMFN